jgi:diguanylate cyclase (GGDEF)-like protein
MRLRVKSGLVVTSRTQSTLWMVAFTAASIVGVDFVVDLALDRAGTGILAGELARRSALGAIAGAVLWLRVIRPLRREADAEHGKSTLRQEALVIQARRQEFEAALNRAVEMAGTIDGVYRVTGRAITNGTPNLDAELLLADSSEAHLKLAVAAGGDGRRARCNVTTPRDCPAIRRAQTLLFQSSETLDACPHLEGRERGACSAVCVPVSVGGRSIGVLHAAAGLDAPPSTADAAALEAVATVVGSRIGMLRVMEATHLQAATDPLTGLLNRRSFENRALELIRTATPFAISMGDLDNFKRLNDTHGHDAGDRALRSFAQTLRATLRDEDIVCRYGGEEFVIVFPRRSATDAAAALTRVQQELLLSTARGSIAPFTVSFGVAQSDQGSDLAELCQIADAALFRAKRQGRDRVVVDTVETDDNSMATRPVNGDGELDRVIPRPSALRSLADVVDDGVGHVTELGVAVL